MTDDQVSSLFHNATDSIDPAAPGLIDAAIHQGRRQRRIARAATAGTAAAIVAGVAVVATSLASGSGGGSQGAAPAGTSVAGAPEPSSRVPVVVAPSRTASVARSTPEQVPMTPQALLQTLLDQLPAGVTSSHYSGNLIPGAFAGIQFQVDDGRGSAALLMGIFRSASANGMTRCTSHDRDCTILADGTTIQIDKQHQYHDNRPGPNPLEWDFVVIRPDGSALNFYEYNAPAPKGEATTRALPPFTTRTVTRWLLSPRFTFEIDKARANRAAHLFTPDDLGGGKPAASPTR